MQVQYLFPHKRVAAVNPDVARRICDHAASIKLCWCVNERKLYWSITSVSCFFSPSTGCDVYVCWTNVPEDLIQRPKYVGREINSSWFQTSAVFWMLYAFFWVIPRRLNFICRRFGTLSHLHRQVGVKNSSHLSAYEDGTECSETSAYKIQTPGNYPEESIQINNC